jgi:hypothetical protein
MFARVWWGPLSRPWSSAQASITVFWAASVDFSYGGIGNLEGLFGANEGVGRLLDFRYESTISVLDWMIPASSVILVGAVILSRFKWSGNVEYEYKS